MVSFLRGLRQHGFNLLQINIGVIIYHDNVLPNNYLNNFVGIITFMVFCAIYYNNRVKDTSKNGLFAR